MVDGTGARGLPADVMGAAGRQASFSNGGGTLSCTCWKQKARARRGASISSPFQLLLGQ